MNDALRVALGALARSCARRPWRVLALWSAAVAVGALGLPSLQDRLTNATFLVEDAPSAQLREALEGQLPVAGPTALVAVRPGPDGAAAVRRVTTAVRALPETRGATIVSSAGNRRPGVVSVHVAPGQDPTQLVDRLRAAAGDAARPHSVAIGGVDAYFADVTRETREDLAHAERIGLPITLIVLVAAFGSLVAAAVPLVVGVAGLVTAFGALLLLSHALDLQVFVLNLAALVGLGVGIDYALLVVWRVRTELAGGAEVVDACETAGRHAGHAVVVAGSAVLLSLSGIFAIGVRPYDGMALGTMITVVVVVAAALTLLPAVIALVGRRLPPARGGSTVGHRLGGRAVRHPVPIALATIALLLVLASPLERIAFGLPGPEMLPDTSGARAADVLVERALGAGAATPILALLPATDERRDADHAANALASFATRLPGVRDVRTSADAPDLRLRDTRRPLVELRVADSAESHAAQDAVRALRRRAPEALVGGLPAARFDEIKRYEQRLPLAVAAVMLATLAILAAAFRSVLMPLKAVAVTLLSTAAALGACVWVFQDGHLVDLLGFQQIDGVPAFLPIFVFPIVFGLSTDYEVFLLSRIAEERRRGLSDREAIVAGLGATARTITGAAAVMISVAGAFAATDLIPTQATGFGMSVAVLLDATVVRLLLVPALLALLGTAAWWWPRRGSA